MTSSAPAMTAPRLGTACASPNAELYCLPWLVPPSIPAVPLLPFEVASTAGGIVAVLCCFKWAVVGKVIVGPGSDSSRAWSLRSTRAAPGAGTLTLQTLFVWSQVIVWMSTVPTGRPSELNASPKVWPAHVKLYFCATELAERYLQH